LKRALKPSEDDPEEEANVASQPAQGQGPPHQRDMTPYLEREPSLPTMNRANPPEYLFDLDTHPLNILFAMIVSDQFIGLDISVLESYEHFIQTVSIAFIARVIFSIIRTGKS
jgi:hypothetical protein